MDGLALEYPLRTERLLLRPFETGDLDAMVEIYSNEETVRHLYEEPHDEAATRARLERKMTARPDDVAFAAVLAATGAFVADLNIVRTSRAHNGGEIGYVLHPAHTGNGYATEAARLLLHLCFEDLRFHRVIGRAQDTHHASRRILAKLGMRHEATFVEDECVKGEWSSQVVYAILDREWAALA